MSTRDSTSPHFVECFRLIIGQQPSRATSTVALDLDEATTAPNLGPRMCVVGDLRALTEAVVSYIGMPVSGSSIAAFLESQGWADADAQVLFHCANLMALGQQIWREGWLIHGFESVEGRSISKSTQTSDEGLNLRGPYFLAIALLQMAGLILAGVSLGTGMGLTSLEATAIGAGLLLGLLWASGFSQLLARDPWSLHLQGDDVLAGLAAFRVITLSMGLAALACGAVIGLVFATTEPAVVAVGLGIACFLLIVLFWLLVNALLAMGLGLASLIAVGLSLAGTTLLLAYAPLDLRPQTAPVVGLTLASILMGAQLVAWWTTKRRRSPPNRHLPRMAGMAIDQSGYIMYGAGFMLLIVLDRMVAWHVGAQSGWLAFQASYEIGLGWAFLAFLGAMVGQERLLARFLRWVSQRMTWHRLGETQGYRRAVRDVYWSRLAIALAIAVASGVVIASFVVWVSTRVARLDPILPVAEGLLVFHLGLLGYGLLSVAGFNTALLVAASRPGRLIVPLVFALCVDLVVAILAAHTLGYAASVLGLVAGAMTLLASSTVQVIHFLKTPAYGLY